MRVTSYIDDVMNLWRTQKSTVKLNFFIDPDIVDEAEIIAERTLTHALINILNNAAEASGDNRKGIEFHVSWDLHLMHIKIRDYGPGFPPEMVERAGRQPLISKKRGLGVGLFLTYSTINRLGGTIRLYNAEPHGACVDITLPLLHAGVNEEVNNADNG